MSVVSLQQKADVVKIAELKKRNPEMTTFRDDATLKRIFEYKEAIDLNGVQSNSLNEI